MIIFQRLKPMVWCVIFAIGVPLSTQAHAHGGLSMAEDMCKLTVGPYMMHFTGYQPSKTQETQFCEDIPATGHTVVVLDYIEVVEGSGENIQALRSLPTEVRIIRDTGSEQDLEAITVLHMPAQVYPKGSVDLEYTFEKPGKFVGLVTVGDKQQDVGRFPFSVGESGMISHSMHYIMIVVPLAAIAGIAAIFFFLRDRRKPSEITVS